MVLSIDLDNYQIFANETRFNLSQTPLARFAMNAVMTSKFD